MGFYYDYDSGEYVDDGAGSPDDGFYNDTTGVDDANTFDNYFLHTGQAPGENGMYDMGDGYYMDSSGNIVLPNGEAYNGSGDVWSGRGDGSTGGYSTPTSGGFLSKLGKQVSGKIDKAASDPWSTIVSGLGALASLQKMRNANAARAPVGAPAASANQTRALNPISFSLPQARPVLAASRYAEGGRVAPPKQNILGFLRYLKDHAMRQPDEFDRFAAQLLKPDTVEPNPDMMQVGAEALRNPGGIRARQMQELGLKRGGVLHGMAKGQSDKVHAMLSDGEYVMDADTVSALGDGNTAAGAAQLDKMRQNIRKHKRSAPVNSIPPAAKAPEQYLKGAK